MIGMIGVIPKIYGGGSGYKGVPAKDISTTMNEKQIMDFKVFLSILSTKILEKDDLINGKCSGANSAIVHLCWASFETAI